MLPPKSDPTHPGLRPSPSEAGFSIIEGIIAALLLLVVTLGVLPLFSRAMENNIKGNDSTRQSNGAVDAFESAAALQFNSGAMTVPPGQTSVVVTESLALKKIDSPTAGPDRAMSNRWELTADLGLDDQPSLSRVRTLRQFSFDDFNDNQSFDNPLDGTVEPRLVHLKVLDVVIGDGTGVGVEQATYTLRKIQAY